MTSQECEEGFQVPAAHPESDRDTDFPGKKVLRTHRLLWLFAGEPEGDGLKSSGK